MRKRTRDMITPSSGLTVSGDTSWNCIFGDLYKGKRAGR